jgi:DNA-binding NarL/FixJ family response regulator
MLPLSVLTSREVEILELVLTGKTNKAIATEISISAKTVEFHLENIYRKLGVRSRVMAGIWALQNGIREKTREIPS